MSRSTWIIIGFLALSVLAALGLERFRVEFDVHRVLDQNEAEVAKLRESYQELPWQHSDASVVLGFGHVMKAADLALSARLARQLAGDPRIATAISLDSIPVVDKASMLPRRFAETITTDQVFQAAWSHPLLRGTLISKDGRSTVVVVRAARRSTLSFDRSALLDWLPERAKELAGKDIDVRVIGSAVVLRTLRKQLESSLAKVLALEVLVFLVLLPLLFHTLRGSLLPIVVVLVAVLLNFGWMAWLDYPLTMLDVAIPGLVVIIGLCDAIHLLQAFEESYSHSGNRQQAVKQMLRRVGKACFYTSLTTGIGLFSLLATEHESVSKFGLKAGIAVFVTFAVVILLLPALLASLPLAAPRPQNSVRLRGLGYGRARLVLLIGIVLAAWTAVGISRVTIDSHLLEELSPAHAVAQDIAWFDQNFSGIIDVETRIRGKLEDARIFAALEDFERAMQAEPGVSRCESVTLFVREALGNPSGRLSAQQVQQGFARLRLVRTQLPAHLADAKFELARVVFKTHDIGSKRTSLLRKRIEELARSAPEGLEIEPAGYVMMATASTRLVVRAITQSLVLSLIVIAIFLGILLRSIVLATIALVSNVLPLAFALGLSGWLGIEVTIGSALIYCLGLGLAVDDSIHILARFLHERDQQPRSSTAAQLRAALQSSGRALITTSIVLFVGALCHLAADFQSLHNVGILLSSVILCALAVDLWVLPLLVERFMPRALHAKG